MKNPLVFRKRPVVIKAILWTGDNWEAIKAFGNETVTLDPTNQIRVTTMEGIMSCSIGNWIICGIKGEFYPCADDIFRATYEQMPIELGINVGDKNVPMGDKFG